MEKLYKVQMNSKGMPNFSTAVEVTGRPQGREQFGKTEQLKGKTEQLKGKERVDDD